MDKKASEFKLPALRLSSRRCTQAKGAQLTVSLSPSLPRIQLSKNSFNTTRIHSPDLSTLEEKPKSIKLPSRLLNPSLYLKNVKESPIRPVNKKPSLEDQELENLIEGLNLT